MNDVDHQLYKIMDFNSTIHAVHTYYCLELFVIDLPQAS